MKELLQFRVLPWLLSLLLTGEDLSAGTSEMRPTILNVLVVLGLDLESWLVLHVPGENDGYIRDLYDKPSVQVFPSRKTRSLGQREVPFRSRT